MSNSQIGEETPLKKKGEKSFKATRMAIIYALIVLFGNGVHPILNNSRPEGLIALIFSIYFSFWEFFIGLMYFLVYKKRQESKFKVKFIDFNIRPDKKWSTLGSMALVGGLFSVATYFYVRGLELAGSISGAIALKTAPIYSIIIGAIYLREKIDFRVVLTLGVLFFVLIYTGTEGTFQVDVFNRGFAILLLVPLLWTIGHAITKKYMGLKIINPLSIIVIRTGIVFIMLFIYATLTLGWESVWNSILNTDFMWFSLLFGGIYFLMHISWYRTIQILELGYASAFVNPSPVITALLALTITHEPIQTYHIVGLTVIIIGLYFMIYYKTHPLTKKTAKKQIKKQPEAQTRIKINGDD